MRTAAGYHIQIKFNTLEAGCSTSIGRYHAWKGRAHISGLNPPIAKAFTEYSEWSHKVKSRSPTKEERKYNQGETPAPEGWTPYQPLNK